MGVFFEPIVELDDGLLPIIPPDTIDDLGFYLSWQLEHTDIRTRAVCALIRETPRRVWWAADDTEFYYQSEKSWRERTGSLARSLAPTIPDEIPDSALAYPIVINTDTGEYFDGDRWPECPLPVLTASYRTKVLPHGWHKLGARWYGNHITVRTREAAALTALTEIAPPIVGARE
ncbi:hypothetical protein EB73_34920 [Mycobacterium sp. SWH-M3]|nr:hypothetical protein EB73_34920 [Mycobacterium sp. SWH-M3]